MLQILKFSYECAVECSGRSVPVSLHEVICKNQIASEKFVIVNRIKHQLPVLWVPGALYFWLYPVVVFLENSWSRRSSPPSIVGSDKDYCGNHIKVLHSYKEKRSMAMIFIEMTPNQEDNTVKKVKTLMKNYSQEI